jgi:hypothetical protein
VEDDARCERGDGGGVHQPGVVGGVAVLRVERDEMSAVYEQVKTEEGVGEVFPKGRVGESERTAGAKANPPMRTKYDKQSRLPRW